MPVSAPHPIRSASERESTPAPRLYLASRSPRRRLLLEEAGIPYTPIESGIDDAGLVPGDVPPEQWVASLSYMKARAGLDRLHPSYREQSLVLGADTVVVKDEHLIGQPADAADAERIVRLLSGGHHRVLTGITLLSVSVRHTFVDAAAVRVGYIPADRIADYVASGNWRGKAGAYNLAERLAEGWPITFEGDPGTVMGLPIQRLAPMLQRRLSLPVHA